MNFNLPLKAFLSEYFDTKTMNGGEKTLTLSALLAKGSHDQLTHQQIKKAWSKTTMKIVHNPSQYYKAHSEGWLESTGKGVFRVTDKGYEHLESLQVRSSPTVGVSTTKLDIFTIGQTHNFDKFLRAIFSTATSEVLIADSYVDETVFDNLLDQIPETVTINFLYCNKQGSFDSRAKRFSRQYSKFTAKTHGSLHDRFLIVDNTGYIIGPSLKDAARKSAATVVSLGNADTKKLRQFFAVFWAQAK